MCHGFRVMVIKYTLTKCGQIRQKNLKLRIC